MAAVFISSNIYPLAIKLSGGEGCWVRKAEFKLMRWLVRVHQLSISSSLSPPL